MKRYHLLGEIGAGGMGKVFLGRDDAGHAVAIKRQHAHLVDDPTAIARFFDEARIAARIQHPNVVGVIDVSMTAGELVLVMDYVEGASLATLHRLLRSRNHRSLHWTEALRIVADALRGLHAAHELTDRRRRPLGVVHRDVSPQNLLVGSDGVTRVTDFGVARAAGRLKSTDTNADVAGKLLYLSPEQVQRERVDRRADVFAAGIVLWECLVGLSLFRAETDAETIANVIRGPIEPPSARANDVPLEVDEICLRALERDPNRRFATAAEFADALEDAGPAPHARIAEAVMACTGDEIIERRRMLGSPASAAAVMLEPAPAAISRPARITPAVIVGVLVGVLAGGLAVGLLARARGPMSAPTQAATPGVATETPTPMAAPASDAPAKSVVELPVGSAVPAPPVTALRPAASTRPATHKPHPARRPADAAANEFVPKEM